jgi:hypothetical protein
MDTPELAAKAKAAIAADISTAETDAATYEKSLVAFITGNKAKVIAIAALIFVPTAAIFYEVGKHFH